MTSRNIENTLIYRALEVGTIDVEARTVQIAFSSENPVEMQVRGVGLVSEILDHSAGAVDLGRLNSNAAVLLEHDKLKVIGKVEKAVISADKIGRAIIRFGKSDMAREVFADVIDGIRSGISVGYKVIKYVQETSREGLDLPTLRAVKWQPYELTLTAIPADYEMQVGRSSELKFNTEVNTMDTKPEVKAAPVVEVNDAVEKATRGELDRLDNIRAIGEQYDCVDLARRAMSEKWTVAQMNTEVLTIMEEKVRNTQPVSQIGLSKTETNQFSLMRAINASFNNDWSKAGFEAECSRAIADELGREAQGFYIPFEVQSLQAQRGLQQRVMLAGGTTGGGYLKGTDHLASSFIDLLRANALMGQLNARFLPGLVGNVDIPRLDGGVAFNWVAEDGDATPDDAVLGTVALTPKTVVGEVPISRRLLKQSAPSVEMLLMDDMAKGAALAIDLAAFSGTGTNQPTGITVASGVGSSTILAPGTPTHVELVEFETDVLTANALGGTLAYCVTAPVQGSLKTTKKDAGSGIFLMENGQANGYPVHVSTQLAANSIIFGNFEDVVIGMWGVLDVEPDKAEKAASGGLVLRVFQDVDIGIRHVGSFSKNA